MTILSNRLSQLRDEKGWTKTYVAQRLNLKNLGTYANYEYGTRQPDNDLLIEIARLYDVSTDYLLGNTDKRHYYDLSNKESTDIAEQAEKMLKGIDTGAALNFYGEPMTDEQKQSMRDILEMGLRINKEKAKKKFTPKKYRGEEKDGE